MSVEGLSTSKRARATDHCGRPPTTRWCVVHELSLLSLHPPSSARSCFFVLDGLPVVLDGLPIVLDDLPIVLDASTLHPLLSVLEYSRIFSNVPEYSRIFPNVPECSRMFSKRLRQDVLEHSGRSLFCVGPAASLITLSSSFDCNSAKPSSYSPVITKDSRSVEC